MNPAAWKGGPAILWFLRLALSGIFIYAGASKLRDPSAFAESIASYQLLPAVLIDPAALTLPPLEIFAGVLALIDGRLRRIGAFGLLTMLAVFLVALASAQSRGLSIDCGCFGADKFDALASTKNLWIALLRDAVLLVTAGGLYVASRRDVVEPR